MIPNLTKEQLERLAILSEELGEVQQVIGKILRHGYETSNPLEENGKTNREKLEMELGDVVCVLGLMNQEKDFDDIKIGKLAESKIKKINKWMHYNKIEE